MNIFTYYQAFELPETKEQRTVPWNIALCHTGMLASDREVEEPSLLMCVITSSLHNKHSKHNKGTQGVGHQSVGYFVWRFFYPHLGDLPKIWKYTKINLTWTYKDLRK